MLNFFLVMWLVLKWATNIYVNCFKDLSVFLERRENHSRAVYFRVHGNITHLKAS